MYYKRFEEVPVWKDAIDLAARVYRMTASGCFRGQAGLRDQIERAAVSISNNIAEGFERGTNQELLTFLDIARGSAGEVRSMLHLLDHLPGFEEVAEESSRLRAQSDSIARQLGGWAESLKGSRHRGHRSQDQGRRQATREIQRRETFLTELRRIQADPAGPLLPSTSPGGASPPRNDPQPS